jgi:3-hydroxyisobutyrate dehydrogenase and related beta-hydroxyacid dehydrogenases
MMDIGFIGLGTMGSLIAENLIKAGNQVRVWNRSRAPVDALEIGRASCRERV